MMLEFQVDSPLGCREGDGLDMLRRWDFIDFGDVLRES
jgi:hypothetical protein